MTTKFTEQIAVKVDPPLKAALENLLALSPRSDFATMGDLLRDILETEVKKRLKKITSQKEDE